MKKEHRENLQSAAIAGISFLGVYGTRKLLEKFWYKTTSNRPPADPADTSNSLGETMVWAVATGMLLSITGVLLSRGLSVGVKKSTIAQS